jgi:hypothetical protein
MNVTEVAGTVDARNARAGEWGCNMLLGFTGACSEMIRPVSLHLHLSQGSVSDDYAHVTPIGPTLRHNFA